MGWEGSSVVEELATGDAMNGNYTHRFVGLNTWYPAVGFAWRYLALGRWRQGNP